MLTATWPPAFLFIIRNALFLGPLGMAIFLMVQNRAYPRRLIGALFSLLYGLALVFVGHVAAIHFGFWTYGGTSLKLLGFPADIWFGGSLLWGPVLFLAFPRSSPWFFVLPFIALNGIASAQTWSATRLC